MFSKWARETVWLTDGVIYTLARLLVVRWCVCEASWALYLK